MKKFLKIGCLSIIGVVVLLGVLGALIGKSTTKTSSSTTQQQVANAASSSQSASISTAQPANMPAEPQPTAVPEPAAPQPTAVPAVGQDVRVGDVRWKVLSAENLGNTLQSKNKYIKPLKTSGYFVRVRFEIENLSNDMLSYGGADVVDDKARKFKSSSDAFPFIPDEEQSVLITNLNPNVPKTIAEIYEVPANASGLKFDVGDLKFLGDDEATIDLGMK
ncbi:MAG: hypothetical protein IPO81_29390 [Kouleothrix sp.]|nr:hypothetical protein [Kouleothrix sp.]